jgi:hypothetical protein
VGESVDTLIGVVHGERDALALKVVDVELGRLGAVLGREGEGELARSWGDKVGGSVLRPSAEVLSRDDSRRRD